MLLLQSAVDLFSLAIAYAMGRLTRHWWDARPLELASIDPSALLFAISALFCITLLAVGERGHVRRRPLLEDLRGIVRAVFISAAVYAVLVLVSKQYSPVTQYLAAWGAALLLIPIGRIVLKRYLLAKHLWQRPTVIVGTGENAMDAYRALMSEPLMGFSVVAFIGTGSNTNAETNNELLALGAPIETESQWSLDRLMKHQIVVAQDSKDSALQTDLMVRLSRAGHRDVFLAPSLRGLSLYGMEMTHFFRHELLLMALRNNLARRGPRLLKRIFDITASLFLLLVSSPVFALIALSIWREGGPVIYSHLRVGLGGKHFHCLKFRTMKTNADALLKGLLDSSPGARAEWDKEQKLKNDPRITKAGRFLRSSSLDELPQLWNVIRGDMSLVGPRPVVVSELARYGEDQPYYMQVRPGITGLWQISGRNDLDYRARVSLDVWYIRNWSLWYDLAILVKTLPIVFQKKGAY